MVAGLLSNRPRAAPPVLNPPGTVQNRPPRSGAPDCRPKPRVALAARQHRKIPPDRASPPPSADLIDRIKNPPKLRGFWRLPAELAQFADRIRDLLRCGMMHHVPSSGNRD